MADIVLPLPDDTVHCARQDCVALGPLAGHRGAASAALAAGWRMIGGKWFCPADVERGRRRVVEDLEQLDGIDQSEPGAIEEIDLGGEG